jgi:kynureninase
MTMAGPQRCRHEAGSDISARARKRGFVSGGAAGRMAVTRNGTAAMPADIIDLAALDAADELAAFRTLFDLPEGVVYLDGNSLGPLPKATRTRLAEVIDREWGRDLIRSWEANGWMDLPRRVGEKIGRLIGAEPSSTIACDSTSVNLFKALAAALRLRPERPVILSEHGNFPTDLYMAEGLSALLGQGHTVRTVESEAIEAGLDASVAVLLLTHVSYRSGRMHDMARITRAAHAAGALVVWDLAHSAGAMPLDLAGCGADFAVGCGYKFLNGGPGAPGFLYAAPRHHGAAMPLTGWMGHADPFTFAPDYRPAATIARAQVGTPHILSLAALEVGVDIALQADMAAVRAKSVRQAEVFAALVERDCRELGFEIASPREAAARGSQICLRHPRAAAIMRALIGRGVIGDFRPPDTLRFGLTPLYLRYSDLGTAARVLAEVAAA